MDRTRRILFLQYTNPAGYPPLEHSSGILAESGWEVLFLGIRAVSAADLLFPVRRGITVKQLPYCPGGWRQKLHYLGFLIWAMAWTARWRPDWVYASDPLACPVALVLHFALGSRLVYHEHDSPARPTAVTGSSIQNPPSAFLRLCYWARRVCGRRSVACILPNQTRADWFARETGANQSVRVVWNCPAAAEVGGGRAEEETSGIRMLYHGSIVPERLPVSVLNAMSMLPEHVTLTAIGYETLGSVGYVATLKQRAAELGIADRFQYLGSMNRFALMKACRSWDVGLALMPISTDERNFHTMVGASNKPFDYLTGGLALLVSDLPEWQEAFVRSGYGIACNPDDPQSIAAALRRLWENPAEMRAMGERGRRRILSEWNYETQFRAVKELLTNGIGSN